MKIARSAPNSFPNRMLAYSPSDARISVPPPLQFAVTTDFASPENYRTALLMAMQETFFLCDSANFAIVSG